MKIELINDRSCYEELLNSGQYKDVGAFVEDMLYQMLTDIFPTQLVVFEPKYKIDGKEQELADVLVLSDDVLLLYECKGRRPKSFDDAGNTERIENWIEKACSDANAQLRKAVDLISSATLMVQNNNALLAIDMTKVKTIVPTVVLFLIEDFFWSEKLLRRKQKYPDLQYFDLRALWLIITYLETAESFVDYVLQKYQLCNAHQDFLCYDENLLKYYLANNRSFEALIRSADPSRNMFEDLPPLASQYLYKPEMKDQLKLIMTSWKAIGPKWRARRDNERSKAGYSEALDGGQNASTQGSSNGE